MNLAHPYFLDTPQVVSRTSLIFVPIECILCTVFNSISVTTVFYSSYIYSQWEAKVTQYERDFDRICVTVRKEVLRFEVCRDCLFRLNNLALPERFC